MVTTKKKISEKVSLASYLIVDTILYVLNKITTKEKLMKNPSQSAKSLKELINHAIFDLEVTQAEYQEIMNMAHDDGVIDKEEGRASFPLP